MMDPDTKPKNAERLPDGRVDPTIRHARKVAHRMDDGEAFLPDPSAEIGGRHTQLTEAEAEAFGEEFIAAATTGEDVSADANDEVAEDEDGGPFLVLDTNEDEPVESEPLDSAPPGDVRRTGPAGGAARNPARRFHP